MDTTRPHTDGRMTPLDLPFKTNATEAIQAAIAASKPLLMLLRDDAEYDRAWIDSRFGSSNHKLHRKQLATQMALLEVIKETTDYSFLLQTFPQFATVVLPSVLIVSEGKIVEMIPRDADISQFDAKLDKHLTLPEEPDQPKKSTARLEPTKTLKEQAAELSAARYRENLLKRQREDEEERERIMRLVKFDRKENRTKAAKVTGAAHDNVSKELENSRDYMLQVKVMDGTVSRKAFPNDTSLSIVREWVLSEHPDYRDVPFYFYKTVDRKTYKDQDESKSLHELNLNRSTLIVRPMDEYEQNRDRERRMSNSEAAENAGNMISWLRKKVGSYLWSEPPTQIHHTGPIYHDSEPVETAPADPIKAAPTTEAPSSSDFNLYGRPQLIDTSSSDNTSSAAAPDKQAQVEAKDLDLDDENTDNVEDKAKTGYYGN